MSKQAGYIEINIKKGLCAELWIQQPVSMFSNVSLEQSFLFKISSTTENMT